jgi:hypothetical protein
MNTRGRLSSADREPPGIGLVRIDHASDREIVGVPPDLAWSRSALSIAVAAHRRAVRQHLAPALHRSRSVAPWLEVGAQVSEYDAE